MFLKQLDLTTALRPAYLPDEVLLFVQDNVGLYEGLVDASIHVPSTIGLRRPAFDAHPTPSLSLLSMMMLLPLIAVAW